MRDSTFALWGLYTLGFDWEANDFFDFVLEMASTDDQIQVMYGVGGERTLTETTLDHLFGYDGARPIRVGNDAYRQKQHDVWGAMLDSVYLHTRSRDRLDEWVWPILTRQVEQARRHWREPDRGIWEIRGKPRHFTSSKVMCWVALDRGAKLARLRHDDELAAEWQKEADEIHRDVLEHGARQARRLHAGVRLRRAGRVAAAPAAGALPATGRRADSGDGQGDRRRADGRRAGAPLPRRGDRHGL